MTAFSRAAGHPIWWDEGRGVWRITSDGSPAEGWGGDPLPCAACHAPTVNVTLATPDYRGCPVAAVDACIAPFVQMLNDNGIRTAASCCGHAARPSRIALADGREIFIAPDFETASLMDAALQVRGGS